MKKNGFSLVEILVAIGIIGAITIGITSFQQLTSQQNNQSKLVSALSSKKTQIMAAIASDAAWVKTVTTNAPATHLSCMGTTSGCTAFAGPYSFDVYDASGNLVFGPGPAAGFDKNGDLCTGPACEVSLNISWKPSCAASDTNCRFPLVQVTGVFSSSLSSLNLGSYNFNLNRSPIQVAACGAVVPPCPGQIAVCASTGWTCVPPNSPYCQGVANWLDSGTSYGPCSETVPGPGILHNTTTSLSNAIFGNTGAANFLCIPGQPNNGFVVQPGATCSGAPAIGLCGPANGTTPGLPPSLPSDLCASGAPSPVAGAGPWTWSCVGTTTVNCSTTPVASPSCHWIRITDNSSTINASRIARSSAPRRALQFVDFLLGAVPEAGACSSTCDTYSWMDYIPSPTAPSDGFILSETFGGLPPPAPPLGSILTNPLCTNATNGTILAGLHNNYCTCSILVTSTWRCDCP